MSYDKSVQQPGALVPSSRQLGMWLFLATVTMLFAGLASAFLVRSSLPDWQVFPAPRLLGLNTLVLLLSSLCLELRQRKKIALLLATLLGGGFLIGQITVWRQLMEAESTYPAARTQPFSTSSPVYMESTCCVASSFLVISAADRSGTARTSMMMNC